MKVLRQGDVYMIPIDGASMPSADRLVEVKRDANRVILAYGEVTGHAHAILDPDVVLFEAKGLEGQALEDRFLSVLSEGGATLTHEEHGPISLPQGNYIVRGQREYSPAEIRRVAD